MASRFVVYFSSRDQCRAPFYWNYRNKTGNGLAEAETPIAAMNPEKLKAMQDQVRIGGKVCTGNITAAAGIPRTWR